MFGWQIVLVILAVVVVAVVSIAKMNRNEKESERQAQREKQERILDQLRNKVSIEFEVELDTVHEIGTQREIVRIVNLLAFETASACVKEDKARRKSPFNISEEGDVGYKKQEWSEKRKLALQICPELAECLPHFSEFEPLKSYNEEHQLQKKSKNAS